MKKNQYKIGFAIPTYKRPDHLRLCIQSIISSSTSYNPPIFILDDSADNTNEEVVRELSKEYSGIVHIKNENNLGIDNNILKSVDCCEADYVWIMGEDDKLIPGAIDYVLSMMERFDLPFIFANYAYVSNDYKRWLSEYRILPSIGPIINGNEFISDHLWAVGFIGSCIVKKKSWTDYRTDHYIGTYFSHVGIIAEIIKDQLIGLSQSVLVLNRAENIKSTSWFSDSFGVMFGWTTLLSKMEDRRPISLIDNLRESSKSHFWHESLLFLLSKRADGIYNNSVYEKYIQPRNYARHHMIIAQIISHLPVFILRALKRAAISARRIIIRNA